MSQLIYKCKTNRIYQFIPLDELGGVSADDFEHTRISSKSMAWLEKNATKREVSASDGIYLAFDASATNQIRFWVISKELSRPVGMVGEMILSDGGMALFIPHGNKNSLMRAAEGLIGTPDYEKIENIKLDAFNGFRPAAPSVLMERAIKLRYPHLAKL